MEDNKSNVYRKPLCKTVDEYYNNNNNKIEEDICTQNVIRDEITRSRLRQNDVAGVFFHS